MKLMYIQYTGDFAEAYQRLIVAEGDENYYGQRYSVSTVVEQARAGIEVMVLVLNSEGYRKKLEPRLESMGLIDGDRDLQSVRRAVEGFQPDRVVITTPILKILKYLRKVSIPTFPVLADSFEFTSGLKSRLNRLRLARELNARHIRWIANHQLNAAKSLANLGIPQHRILAYDWVHQETPEQWTKQVPSDLETKTIELFYAGTICQSKGVLDLVRAVKSLQMLGRSVSLRLVGRGKDADIDAFIRTHQLTQQISFLGPVSHAEVLQSMNAADLVIVPSQHRYPEGLPMTIMESLMVHTPVIASDHPMFVGRVGGRGAVTFFRAEAHDDLARCVLEACSDRDNYLLRTLHAPLEWHDLCLELKWGDLINRWIEDPLGCDFSGETLDNALVPTAVKEAFAT